MKLSQTFFCVKSLEDRFVKNKTERFVTRVYENTRESNY
jgi:hypothetical protein